MTDDKIYLEMINNFNAQFNQINQKLASIENNIKNANHVLFDNGQPGLQTQFNNLENEFIKHKAEVNTYGKQLKMLIAGIITSIVGTFGTALHHFILSP